MEKFNPEALLALEGSFLKVPMEQLKRSMKPHKDLDRELAKASSIVKDLCQQANKGEIDVKLACENLEAIGKKLEGLKRKLNEANEEEKKHISRGRKRLDHLVELTQIRHIGDPEYKKWNEKRIDRILADYMLREGFSNTAELLASESEIGALSDIELFTQARAIEQALRGNNLQGHKLGANSCTEALKWCNENRSNLRKINSTLEFNLRVQEFIELCRADKKEEAIEYSRKHFKTYLDNSKKDSQQGSVRRNDSHKVKPRNDPLFSQFLRMMGILAFPPNTKCRNYKALYDHSRWELLIVKFRSDFYALNSLPSQPLLNVTLQAGLSALKTPMCYQPDNQNINCPVCSSDTLGILAQDLPMSHHVNSTIVCRISGKIMNENNPPMALPNGYVYSYDALQEMDSKIGKIVCPRTNEPFQFSQLKKSNWFTEPMSREHLKQCNNIIRELKHHSNAAPFLEPVDPVKYGIPDYFDIIKKPMDLGTVDTKLNNVEYGNVDAFIADVRLIFSNCILYNGPAHQYSIFAKELDNVFTNLVNLLGSKEEVLPKPVAESSSKASKTCKPVAETSTPTTTIPTSTTTVVATTKASSEAKRPKRTIKAPAKDLPDAPAMRRKKSKKNIELNFCRQVLRELRKRTHWHYAYPFYEPVDAEKLGVPDYYKIISHPMDLSTINSKLENDQYTGAEEFEADIRLMFQNCYTYNGVGSEVHNMGKMLEDVFNKKWAEKPTSQTRQTTKVDDMKDSESESEVDETLQKHLAALSSQISQMRRPSKAKTKKAAKISKASSSKIIETKTNEGEKKSLKRPRAAIKYDDDEPLTADQKSDLSQKIDLLSTEKMNELINLIESSGAPMERGNGGYELEIESLDYKTARMMYEFVLKHTSSNQIKEKKKSPSKRSRSNANEEENEKKIQALERTLAKFDHKSPTLSAQVNGGHYSSEEDSTDSQSSDSSGSESEDS
ncbi:5279_t:CDS:10, partial [Acaulospora colombiana]